MPLSFSYQKTTQALNFFAQQNGGIINKLKALKLLYFADRYHLRKYGRLVTNDEYFAMRYGPVASGAKDLAEGQHDWGRGETDQEYAAQYIRPDSRRYEIQSRQSPNHEVFSQSDLEALDFSYQTFGQLGLYELAELTHRYPEWKKHEAVLNNSSRVLMDAVDFLEDPPGDCDPCHSLTEEERSIRREEFVESRAIHRLLH
ncbi:MAG: SocA family protein [Verrucomicrobiales bacterium]|nr:SocA family protein [Verrucomicrobiales bacterium]